MNTVSKAQSYRFRESVNAVQTSPNTVLIGSTRDNFIEITITNESLANALAMLAQGHELGDIEASIADTAKSGEFIDIVMFLIAKGLLESRDGDSVESHSGRFDRQILFFREVLGISLEEAKNIQRKIESARIGVLGLGGVGSYVVRTLSSMGFGQIALLDYDVVEESNISRQIFYDYRDIGRLKGEVVSEKIRHISPSTKVVSFHANVGSIADIQPVADISDVILCAIDTPRPNIYDIVSRIPFQFGVPTVYGGSVTDNICVGPTVKRNYSKCLKCIRGIVDCAIFPDFDLVHEITSNYKTALIDPVNSLAASFMSMEAVKLICGYSEPMFNKSFLLNLDSFEKSSFELSQDDTSCSICASDFDIYSRELKR